MSDSPLKDVVAHWHKLIEGFSTTSLGFYEAVEEALARRKIPGLKTSRVNSYEGGILSPQREYLRVRGEHHVFEMCAAPFGTGYFFSSWVTRKAPDLLALYYAGFAAYAYLLWRVLLSLEQQAYHVSTNPLATVLVTWVANPVVLTGFAIFLTLWSVGVLAHGGRYEPEGAMLTVPFVGALYRRVFSPETYYRIDTMLMFQSAVHSAMLEVINGLLTQKGLRALGEDERKPIYRELVEGSDGQPDRRLRTEAALAGAG